MYRDLAPFYAHIHKHVVLEERPYVNDITLLKTHTDAFEMFVINLV